MELYWSPDLLKLPLWLAYPTDILGLLVPLSVQSLYLAVIKNNWSFPFSNTQLLWSKARGSLGKGRERINSINCWQQTRVLKEVWPLLHSNASGSINRLRSHTTWVTLTLVLWFLLDFCSLDLDFSAYTDQTKNLSGNLFYFYKLHAQSLVGLPNPGMSTARVSREGRPL